MEANWSKRIALATTGLILLFGLIGNGPTTYRVAIFFLGPLVWGVYTLKDQLRIEPWQFALFAGALLLHDLGAFGLYSHFYGGLEFDTYVHFVFGIAGGFIVVRALRLNFGLAGWKMWLGTVLIIMGFGALHELLEYVSTVLLGSKGMLKLNDPDTFDTQKDLGNNLLGCLTALMVYTISRALRGRGAKCSQAQSSFPLSTEQPERA